MYLFFFFFSYLFFLFYFQKIATSTIEDYEREVKKMNLRWAPCSRTEDLWSAVVNTSPTSFIYHYWHFSSVFDLPLSNLVFMHLKSFGSPHIKHSNVKLCKAIECSNFKAFCFSHFFLFNETSLALSNACMRDLKEKV